MELGDGIVGPELSAAKQSSVISHEGKEGMFVDAFVQWEVLAVCLQSSIGQLLLIIAGMW